jgi:transposase-like protein
MLTFLSRTHNLPPSCLHTLSGYADPPLLPIPPMSTQIPLVFTQIECYYAHPAQKLTRGLDNMITTQTDMFPHLMPPVDHPTTLFTHDKFQCYTSKQAFYIKKLQTPYSVPSHYPNGFLTVDGAYALAVYESERWGVTLINHNGTKRDAVVPMCPRCLSKNTKRRPSRFYVHCNDCRKDFTVLTGTPMQGTRVPLCKWIGLRMLKPLHLTQDQLSQALQLSVRTIASMQKKTRPQ